MSVYFEEPEWLRVGRLTFESLIALCGVLGNIAVILAVASRPLMQTVTNIFIRNLAVADLGVLLLSFPFAVIKEQTVYHWPLGRDVCQIVYPLSELFIGVSSWSMAIIAIDRYRGIVTDSHLRSLPRARYICVIPWISSFAITSVPLLTVMKYWESKTSSDCFHDWPARHRDTLKQAYVLGTSLYNYAIPLTIIVWTYYKIFRKLAKSTAFNKASRAATSGGRNTRRHDEARIRRNVRAKKILTPVVVVFAVTILPVTVMKLAINYAPKLIFFRYFWFLYNACIISSVLNSAANPFIYAIVSDNFRMAFRGMFRIRFKLRRRGQQMFGRISSASESLGLRTRRSRLSTITSLNGDQSPVMDTL